jgi:hypothetical protein
MGISIKPSILERRKAAVNRVMDSNEVRDFIKDQPRSARINVRNWLREFIEAGYDEARSDIAEILSLMYRSVRL